MDKRNQWTGHLTGTALLPDRPQLVMVLVLLMLMFLIVVVGYAVYLAESPVEPPSIGEW